jgi:hypothetical protein
MHRIDTVTVNDSSMEIFMYTPDTDGPHPGIVLTQHIPVGHTGVENDEFTLKAAERSSFIGGLKKKRCRSSATSSAMIGQHLISRQRMIT